MSETSPTIPVAGSVLDGESVKLLQKGDMLRCSDRGQYRIHEVRSISSALGGINVDGGGMFAPYLCTFIGRPDQDGWIEWRDDVAPLSGRQVDVKSVWYPDEVIEDCDPDNAHWSDIIAFRPHREVSGEGNGSLQPQEAVVPTEQTDEPAGQSWEEGADAMIVALMPKLQKALTKAAESLYEEVLDTAEEYLKDNVRYNVQSAIDSANRQALHDRRALKACEQHREELFWALKALISTARAEDAKGDLGARLMATVDKAEQALDAKPEQVTQ